jgi:MFS family permease
MLVAVALFTLSTGITHPIFALFATRLGVSPILIGIITALGVGANALTRPLSGRLADRYGRHRFLAGGLALLTAATALYAVTPATGAAAVLAVASMLVGVGAATFWPALKASVVEHYLDDRQRALGHIQGTQGVCTAIGATVGGVVAGTFGYRWAYIAGAAALLAAVFVLARPRKTGPSAAASDEPLGDVAESAPPDDNTAAPTAVPRKARQGLLTLGGMIAAVNIGLGAILGFLALYVAQVYHKSTLTVGVLYTAIFLGTAVGGLLLGRFSAVAARRRVGQRLVLAATLVGSTVICLLTPVLGFDGFAATQTLLAVLLTAAMITMTVLSTELMQADALATVIGTVEAIGFGAALLGPVLGGIVFTAARTALFPAAGTLFAASLLALLATWRLVGRPAPASSQANPATS